MTIPLQPTRDSISVQSRTAPVISGSRPGFRGVSAPGGSHTGAKVTAFGTRIVLYSPFPATATSSARVAAGSLCQGDLAPGFPAHPQRQSCPRVQTEPPWGLSQVALLGNRRLLRKGLAEQSSRDALQATTATMRLCKKPHGGGNPQFRIFQSFESLRLLKAQANCGRRATP